MAGEGDAFLRAICTEPADDTARLVYADWLEEQEQVERAEFIRVQVELAKRGPGCSDHVCRVREDGSIEKCENCLLRQREQKLWGVNVRKWLGLPESHCSLEFLAASCHQWGRGFPSAITCTAEDWLAHADRLFWSPRQNRPWPGGCVPLEKVSLTTWPEFAGWEWFPKAGAGRIWVNDRWPGLVFDLEPAR